MKILRSTPLMTVDRIEAHLDFWVERLGYARTVEVPHGDTLGFVILERDGQQVMFQTRQSISDDLPDLLPLLEGAPVIQYVDVESLDAVLERLQGWDFLVPPRETFYGAREVFVQDPAGYIVGFAEHKSD